VTDETNDKKQAQPMAQAILETLAQARIERPTDARGEPAAIVATLDNGYYSEAAAQALEEMGFDPYIAAGRVPHHGAPPEIPEASKTAKERMAAKVRSAPGRALYARRKVIAEPVFGQIKEGRGCRRFSFRGLTKMRGEWCLVCLTHNLLKIWRYGCAPMAA
jgi:Transposase DDE domain